MPWSILEFLDLQHTFTVGLVVDTRAYFMGMWGARLTKDYGLYEQHVEENEGLRAELEEWSTRTAKVGKLTF